MEDNKDMVSSTETEQVGNDTTKKSQTENQSKEKSYSRDDVNKMLNAEREKVKAELLKDFENKKSEAEKLAKMDAEQKLNYELEQKTKENEDLKNQLNSVTLRNQANTYANEKGLPMGYIEDFDYAKETAETIKEKIDKLVKLRNEDLDGMLKEKLKQNPPKAISDENNKVNDPYLQGFKNYMAKGK